MIKLDFSIFMAFGAEHYEKNSKVIKIGNSSLSDSGLHSVSCFRQLVLDAGSVYKMLAASLGSALAVCQHVWDR